MENSINLKFLKISSLKISDFLGSIFLLMAAFSSFFNKIGPFKYFDELIGLISVCYVFINGIYKNKTKFKIIISLCFVVFMGIISNLLHMSYITNKMSILVDGFSLIKNHFSFIAFIGIFNICNKKKVSSFLSPFLKIFVFITFFCGLVNIFVETSWAYDIRLGIRSFKFFFSNPADLASPMFLSMAIFLINKDNKAFIILALANCFFTLRTGVIALIPIYFLLDYYYKHKLNLKKIIYILVLLFIFVFAIIGYKNYFATKDSPRYLLLKNSLILFKDNFPFGTGLATYGSSESFKYYSPIYYEIGFNNAWGLSPETGYFINDNFWPMVLAQIGLFGVIGFAYVLYNEFKLIKVKGKYNALIMTLFISILISTTASANLTGSPGLFAYTLISFLIDENTNYERLEF